MIVEEIMKKKVHTLVPTDSIAAAIKLIDEEKIRHIPVVNESNQLVGIISDRDIRDAKPSILNENDPKAALENPISNIMKTEIITGHPLDFVEEISAIFYEHRISCLPIEKEGKLVGIVTETDLLHTLVQLTGAHQPGSQLEVKVLNRTGVLAEVVNIIKKYNVNISSVLVYPDKDLDFKVLVFRVQTMNPTGIITNLKEEGYTVMWPNIPGYQS
ncbi:acetoin utilization AcuB family protein [Ferdinandcohnia quinoae]|uniref:Acetoin utilization AcuB family protein n=1 Tax=Fredinandcohnia quinoae TaxID=2918902 RepID=A0AAW5DXE1_9BACI|nr:acetoin utilization AcuB family protein [Fredinandcohnia sp. SECRCQ15]MCH1625337.1 acetoin utilization AcuB family protein [Fredinandcohnia sp. SECRCQ15]